MFVFITAAVAAAILVLLFSRCCNSYRCCYSCFYIPWYTAINTTLYTPPLPPLRMSPLRLLIPKRRTTRLAHELGGRVLSRKELVEILEVVLGQDVFEHLRGGTDVHDPVGLFHEGVRFELGVDGVRSPVHLRNIEMLLMC